jgi:hypothetical protein
MEYIAAAVILYFILQTAGNLVLILRGDKEPAEARPSSSTDHGWEGPSPRNETKGARGGPTFWGEDIDEARWQDV